jgi:hypothetical protein
LNHAIFAFQFPDVDVVTGVGKFYSGCRFISMFIWMLLVNLIGKLKKREFGGHFT